MRIYPNLTVDGEFKSLGDQGHMGTLNDRQFSFLRSKGYQNSLADMMTSWLAYSPANLFSVGEQGVWFDPSDVANLTWRRNLLTWTEQFDNTVWIKSELTVTPNVAVAPDGTMTADKIIGTTGTGGKFAYQSVTVGGANVFSFYAKAAEYYLVRTIEVGSYAFYATFNLQTGAVTATGGANFVSASAVAVGNGWYRCSIATTKGTSNAYSVAGFPDTVAPTNVPATYTGDGTSGAFFWGAQVETGSVATEYQRITDLNTEVIERFPNATLYQDTAGTTPVTTTGQSVGLMLDKSKGLVLGSELVTNGTFDTDTAWTKGTGWTISGGRATFNNAAGSELYQNLSLSAGFYQVTFIATGSVSGSAYFNSPSISPAVAIKSGENKLFLIHNGSYTRFTVLGTGGANFTIDNISVKELPGNHAVQATTANRPIYGIHPVGGRRNLLVRTEEFENANWAKTSATVTANAAAAPDGTTTADLIQFSAQFSNIRQSFTFVSGQVYTCSVWVWVASGTRTFSVRENNLGTELGTINATTTPTRYSVTFTVAAGWAGNNALALLQDRNASGFVDTYIWGAQLETGSTATAYQRVTDQYNVTEAGVPSVSYLFFDGVNDSLATPTITPGVDKAQVFAGVRKLSDAARGIVVETSAASSNGSFNISAPVGASPSYRFASLGTLLGIADVLTGYPSPITNVLTGIGDISGDNATLRVNGTQAAQSTDDQGTGNYGNFQMFIGARGGTSLFFSGHLYSLIARFGPNLATGQISSTETWVAGKTGITI